MDDVTALYRHYDADGTLLYVGIAISPIARLCEHRVASAWYDEIATVKIRRYPTRDLALAAELEAIRGEKPLHNIAGALTPPTPASVAPRGSSRKASRLSALGVAAATRPGYYCDGAGLYLLVSDSGTKSWVFRFTLNGRKREMGLGAVALVGLAEARDAAHEQRKLLRNKVDPIEARRSA